MPVEIILNQILILAIIAVTGVIASWCKVINEVTKDFIAQIIFNVTLPSMLLTNFSRLDLTPRLLSNSLQFLILAVIVHFFMLFTG
jgi:predicted permease